MEIRKLLKYSEYFLTGIVFAGIFIFFAFFYNYHLHFEEQTQLFLLTKDYFFSKMSFPGGFSGYTGGFLTQFYFLSLAGPLIITLLLFGIQQSMRHILSVVNGNNSFFMFSFLPSLNAAMILCDEFYQLSAVTGFFIALLFSRLYVSIKKDQLRFVTGILLLPLTYWLTGGSFLMLLAIMLVFEIVSGIRVRREAKKGGVSDTDQSHGLATWKLIVYFIIALGVPMLVRRYLILEPVMLAYLSEFYYDLRVVIPNAIPILFALPALLMIAISWMPDNNKIYRFAIILQLAVIIFAGYFGIRLWANFGAEDIMEYDYLVRNGRWNDVIKLAEKNPPKNNLSLAMLNLSLAKTDKMGDKLFSFEQNGNGGLFLPFKKEYVAPMMGNEIFFQLGLINASQEYVFESMETTPNLNKTVRAIKRLAETNLINGNYEVADKYIELLKHTIFYHKWAIDTERYLYREDLINNHPVWGEKRRMMTKDDFFFKVENMENTLNILLHENPGNRVAFEYLMAFYLINKDLRNFMNHLPLMNEFNYREIPVSYQEAIMYVIGLTSVNPMSNTAFKISSDTKARMKAYADIYTAYADPKELLRKRFSGTFWYYFHFKAIEIKSEKSK